KTPIMKALAVAAVAGMRLQADDVDQRRAGEPFGHPPGFRLVDPHERRLDHEADVHAEVQRDLHRLHRIVAAVRIAGIVRLADAENKPPYVPTIRERGGEGEEKEIAP